VRGPKAGQRQAGGRHSFRIMRQWLFHLLLPPMLLHSCLLHACFMPDVGLPVGLSRQGDTVSPREGK